MLRTAALLSGAAVLAGIAGRAAGLFDGPPGAALVFDGPARTVRLDLAAGERHPVFSHTEIGPVEP